MSCEPRLEDQKLGKWKFLNSLTRLCAYLNKEKTLQVKTDSGGILPSPAAATMAYVCLQEL